MQFLHNFCLIFLWDFAIFGEILQLLQFLQICNFMRHVDWNHKIIMWWSDNVCLIIAWRHMMIKQRHTAKWFLLEQWETVDGQCMIIIFIAQLSCHLTFNCITEPLLRLFLKSCKIYLWSVTIQWDQVLRLNVMVNNRISLAWHCSEDNTQEVAFSNNE